MKGMAVTIQHEVRTTHVPRIRSQGQASSPAMGLAPEGLLTGGDLAGIAEALPAAEPLQDAREASEVLVDSRFEQYARLSLIHI